jgi:hypothetical protein
MHLFMFGVMCDVGGASHSLLVYRQRFLAAPRDFREQVERMLGIDGPFSPGQRTTATILGVNLCVFGLWSAANRGSVNSLLNLVMSNFFLCYPVRDIAASFSVCITMCVPLPFPHQCI